LSDGRYLSKQLNAFTEAGKGYRVRDPAVIRLAARSDQQRVIAAAELNDIPTEFVGRVRRLKSV
jgi:hypothetical protein